MGLLKTVLIYAALFTAGLISYRLLGGYQGARLALPGAAWFSLFPDGVGKGLASGFSALVGFISTQTYLQAVFAAKDVRSARRGVFWTGLLIPLAGLGATVVGMYMRAAHPGIEPATALPLFLVDYFNPWAGGAALAALLISLVLSGAALCLGVSVILVQDIYCWFRPQAGTLLVSRVTALLVGALSLIFVLFNMETLILKWAFLSMALRGIAVFVPLVVAVFAVGRAVPGTGLKAVILAPLAAMLWGVVYPGGLDPLYVGMGLSIAILAGGIGKRKVGKENIN